VVDVTDRADVHVGLGPLELLLRHLLVLLASRDPARSGGGIRTRDTAIMSRLLCL